MRPVTWWGNLGHHLAWMIGVVVREDPFDDFGWRSLLNDLFWRRLLLDNLFWSRFEHEGFFWWSSPVAQIRVRLTWG
jgi:hypothetical protein